MPRLKCRAESIMHTVTLLGYGHIGGGYVGLLGLESRRCKRLAIIVGRECAPLSLNDHARPAWEHIKPF